MQHGVFVAHEPSGHLKHCIQHCIGNKGVLAFHSLHFNNHLVKESADGSSSAIKFN